MLFLLKFFGVSAIGAAVIMALGVGLMSIIEAGRWLAGPLGGLAGCTIGIALVATAAAGVLMALNPRL